MRGRFTRIISSQTANGYPIRRRLGLPQRWDLVGKGNIVHLCPSQSPRTHNVFHRIPATAECKPWCVEGMQAFDIALEHVQAHAEAGYVIAKQCVSAELRNDDIRGEDI